MTSITAQQTKINLEIVPKDNRLDIGKCNGRIPSGLKLKEETFQVILDALALTSCYPAFVITADVPEIDNRGYKKHKKMYYPRFTEVIIHHFLIQDKTLSWRNKISMHTSKDDYLINTLRFVSRKEASQKYGVVLPECLTSPQMTKCKAYKTYLDYATATVPPKVPRKFKKASPSKKDSVPVPANEEPIQKGKRVMRSAKKSLTTPTIGIVIREPLVETQSKRKEKIDVTRGKGIDLLSKGNDDNDNNDKEDIEQENDSEEHESDSNQDTDGSELDSKSDQQDDNDDDDEVKDDDDDDQSEGDKDRDMDSDDVLDTKANVRMTDAQQEKENLEITQEQVIEDAHVTITKKTEVPVTNSSRSSELASKFLNFLDIPPADREIVSPLDVHVHHEVPRIHTSTLLDIPVSSLNQVNLAKPSSQPQSTYEAAATLIEYELKKILMDKMNSSESYLTAQEHRECYDGLIKSYNLEKDFFSSYDVYSLKRSRYDKDKDEGPSAGSDPVLKKRKTSKDAKLTTSPKSKDSSSRSSKGTKSQPKSSRKSVHVEEPEFEVGDTNTPQEKLDWENLEGDDYPFDLSKPLPLVTCGNSQSVPVVFFIKNDLKHLSSLEDITNIDMEYLLKRRWSTLEKKRALYMIKDINKLLKERRMMTCLEKFIGGRLYETDLRLLQRSI
nr:hypothetical protein [Tanacetum cinerariifolium]